MDVSDKMAHIQSLWDGRDLTPEEAVALLGAIHTDLKAPEGHAAAVYERCAELMESLRTQMPDVHQRVVEAWGGQVDSPWEGRD